MNINKKDRRILYELDSNSRQSLSQIGKKVKLPKNVVSYRIKRMEKERIITGYHAVVDASRLGYSSARFYLTFQNTTTLIEKEIIEYFKKNPNTWWVAETEPLFDFAVIIWIKDMKEFYAFWEETMSKYGHYLQDFYYSNYIQAVHYKYEYLLNKKTKEKMPEITGANEKIKIDKTEESILRLLARNARMPLIKIAHELSTTAKIVQYRIKKLIKEKIIVGFRTSINIQKIGYNNYRLNIYLSDYSQKKKIETYITQSPSLIYINRAVGHAHLEYELHLSSLEKLHEFIEDIKNKFPEIIRSYDYFIFRKVHKEQFMPVEITEHPSKKI